MAFDSKQVPSSYRVALRGMLWLVGWIVMMFAAANLLGTSYRLTIGANAAIAVLLALSVVIVTGFAGQFSLASAAFYGIGAYGSGILTTSYGWPPLAAAVVAALTAGSVALMVGRPILRLSGHFLAMGTLALNEIFILLIVGFPDFTGGNDGKGGIPSFSVWNYDFASLQQQLYLAWSVVGVALYLTLRLQYSRMGRALAFIRSDETGSAAVGIDPGHAKAMAFTISAVFASIAGSLYAHFLGLVSPEPFNVMASVQILVIAVLGGIASPWGAVVGGITYALLQEVIVVAVPRFFGEAAVGAGSQFVVGTLLVVLLIVRPQGLASFAQLVRGWFGRSDSRDGEHDLAPPTQISLSTTPAGTNVLKAVDLSRSFGGIHALANCNIDVAAAEILAVIGPNGAGKTTLVHVLSGALSPSSGEISILGSNVTRQPAHLRAGRFGLARSFQTPKIVTGLSVKSNAALGAHRLGAMGFFGAMVPTRAGFREESAIDEAALQALRAVGLGWAFERHADELSLGHRRLLEIGRVISQKPTVILLDEPAAGLTRVEKDELVKLLVLVRKAGYGILLVEHDMDVIMALADRIHVLVFGKTIFCGSPADARSDANVIAAYLGTKPKELAL